MKEGNKHCWKTREVFGDLAAARRRKETDKILHLTKRENQDEHPRFLFLIGLLCHAIGAAKVQRDAGRMKHE